LAGAPQTHRRGGEKKSDREMKGIIPSPPVGVKKPSGSGQRNHLDKRKKRESGEKKGKVLPILIEESENQSRRTSQKPKKTALGRLPRHGKKKREIR